MRSFGCTLQQGGFEVSVSGYPSEESAEIAAYCKLYDIGGYHLPKLKTRWWQFWRDTEYSGIDLYLFNQFGEK